MHGTSASIADPAIDPAVSIAAEETAIGGCEGAGCTTIIKESQERQEMQRERDIKAGRTKEIETQLLNCSFPG